MAAILYFGLIGRNAVDDERVIPFGRRSKPASNTTLPGRRPSDRPEPARIGLLSTLPGMSALTDEAGYSRRREMGKTFTVELIEENFVELPAEIDVLMLVHPPEFTPWQLWQIDQFILRTGRALILLDPAAKTAQGTGPFNMTNRQIRSDLDQFAPVWGVRLAEDAIADTETALSIEAVRRRPNDRVTAPALLGSAARTDVASIVTADLGRTVNLGAPGRLSYPIMHPVPAKF